MKLELPNVMGMVRVRNILDQNGQPSEYRVEDLLSKLPKFPGFPEPSSLALQIQVLDFLEEGSDIK